MYVHQPVCQTTCTYRSNMLSGDLFICRKRSERKKKPFYAMLLKIHLISGTQGKICVLTLDLHVHVHGKMMSGIINDTILSSVSYKLIEFNMISNTKNCSSSTSIKHTCTCTN